MESTNTLTKKRSAKKILPTTSLSNDHYLAGIHDAIRLKAYELFVERGCVHGADVDDWLNAEKIIQEQMSTKA